MRPNSSASHSAGCVEFNSNECLFKIFHLPLFLFFLSLSLSHCFSRFNSSLCVMKYKRKMDYPQLVQLFLQTNALRCFYFEQINCARVGRMLFNVIRLQIHELKKIKTKTNKKSLFGYFFFQKELRKKYSKLWR